MNRQANQQQQRTTWMLEHQHEVLAMNNLQALIDELIEAKESGEFPRQAPLLRTIFAVNPDYTKKEGIAAAVAAGFNPDTAAIQFSQSRRESALCGDVLVAPDGRLIDNPDWKF